MNDPARRERIEAAARGWDPLHYDGYVGLELHEARVDAGAALEAADAVEPRPVYLTAEEIEALLSTKEAG